MMSFCRRTAFEMHCQAVVWGLVGCVLVLSLAVLGSKGETQVTVSVLEGDRTKSRSTTRVIEALSQSETCSVIVVSRNPHPSNLFRDEDRVNAYSDEVVLVQFASPDPHAPLEMTPDQSPFYVGHPDDVHRRVRMVHTIDLVKPRHLNDNQTSHLKATCEDPSETTVLVVTDEACERLHLPRGTPPACWSNVARHYPYNAPRSVLCYIEEQMQRHENEWPIPLPHLVSSPAIISYNNRIAASLYDSDIVLALLSPSAEIRNAYIPLGPRDTFKFVESSRRQLASRRSIFFNLETGHSIFAALGKQVSRGTAQRRNKLIDIAVEYKETLPDGIRTHVEGPHMNANSYQQLLLDSKFTLCPGGHNPETFRMFEALEAGSIPIVSKQDYLDPDFKSPNPCGVGNASWNTVAAAPFAQAVSVESWDDLPQLMDILLHLPAEYVDTLQAGCVAWYEALMRRTYESVLNFGKGLELWPQSGPVELPGFPYHHESGVDWSLPPILSTDGNRV